MAAPPDSVVITTLSLASTAGNGFEVGDTGGGRGRDAEGRPGGDVGWRGDDDNDGILPWVEEKLDELGAESIDLLDILFRIDRATGVKIQSDELASYVQGGIPDEEFGDEDADVITPKGMEQLKKVMPQIAEKDLDGKLSPEDVMSHFTVANLTELVASRA